MSGAPKARVILLACGSYNPITNMHLRMFELAKDALQKTGKYNVVGGIVSPVNDAYGKKDLVSANHRAAMARLALKSSDWIRLDTWETEQESWTETNKVLRHHKNCLDSMYNANPLPDTPTKKRKLDQNSSPGSVDQADYAIPSQYHNQNQNDPCGAVQLKLLCGADLLESFAVPGLWSEDSIEDIVSRYGVVCISRSGTNAEKFIYESDLLTKHMNEIQLVTEWIYNDISATKIRRALRRGQSVKYLLQDSVIDYIKAHNLYGASDNRYFEHLYPSPTRDDLDSDCLSDPSLLSPSVGYRSLPTTYQPLRHDSSFDSVEHRNRKFRRHHRGCNFDEEHKRKDYRSDDSFDSLDSFPRSPQKQTNCLGADIAGLVRRVRGMRMAVSPETCV